MKILRIMLVISLLPLLLMACGTESDSENFVEYVVYTFNTAQDIELPITQEAGILIESGLSFQIVRDDTYTIESNDDLNNFNSTLDDSDKITMDDLDTYTYFFVRANGCGDYYKYITGKYSANVVTITLAHFQTPDVACIAVVTDNYLVFKAMKPS